MLLIWRESQNIGHEEEENIAILLWENLENIRWRGSANFVTYARNVGVKKDLLEGILLRLQ